MNNKGSHLKIESCNAICCSVLKKSSSLNDIVLNYAG